MKIKFMLLKLTQDLQEQFLIFQKVTDIPIVAIATKAIMGHTIEEQGYSYGIVPEKETIAVKMPVFSFEKNQRCRNFL